MRVSLETNNAGYCSLTWSMIFQTVKRNTVLARIPHQADRLKEIMFAYSEGCIDFGAASYSHAVLFSLSPNLALHLGRSSFKQRFTFHLLHFAFHAPLAVQPIPPCMGVRSSSTAAHPASLACPGLRIPGQPVQRRKGSQDLFLCPFYP